MSVRIQRKRTKGWRMPPNTISVTRPGKFGNPFIKGNWVPEEFDEMYLSYDKFENCPDYLDNLDFLTYAVRGHEISTNEDAVRLFEQYLSYLKDKKPEVFNQWKVELKGKNLACFCPLDVPCHADVLLSVFNDDGG
ncbi:MAG: DUF4326 domain-containing protein [Saprospiraceae bacterium]